MGQYFKPLRRKIGVVTLAMAVALALGWVRSSFKCDSAQSHVLGSMFSIVSSAGKLYGLRLTPMQGSIFHWSSADALTPPPIDWKVWELLWRWESAGIECQLAQLKKTPDLKFYLLAAPYWMITIPLTLLSAWLLVSKPRIAKKPSGPPT